MKYSGNFHGKKKDICDLGSEVDGQILKRFRGNQYVKTMVPSRAQFKNISKRCNQSNNSLILLS